MIRSHEDFERALAEGLQLLDAAPPDGTPAHARLLALMKDIAAYRPTIQVNAQKAIPEAERLSQRLDAFETRLAPHFTTHWHSMIGGDFRVPDR